MWKPTKVISSLRKKEKKLSRVGMEQSFKILAKFTTSNLEKLEKR